MSDNQTENSVQHEKASACSSRQQAKQRQVWTLVFAIIAIWVARSTSAQSIQPELGPCSPDGIYYGDANLAADWNLPVSNPIQFDAITSAPIYYGDANSAMDWKLPANDGIQFDTITPTPIEQGFEYPTNARPRYIEMSASLANFDADPEPDGWNIQLALRDQKDRPVVQRSNARIELIPRVSRYTPSRLEGTKPLRWSVPLEFDDDGVARFKLPLRNSQRSQLGWPNDNALRSFSHRTTSRRSSSRSAGEWYIRGRNNSGRIPTVLRSNLQDRVTIPEVGELRARVSVPSQGTFEAITEVTIRPSVLVDTRWP